MDTNSPYPGTSTGPIAWMTRNSVAANLLMLVLIVGGFLSLRNIRQEVFPEFELDMVLIAVPYPGASPEEVEQGVVLAIEEAIRSVDGVKEIDAVASEGSAVVTVELQDGADANIALADIKSAVDRITSLPEDAEQPIISLATTRSQVISIAVYGDQSERTLRAIVEEMREELLDLPEISTVELAGVRPYEISIEVPQENLRRYNLTLDAIAQRIRAASVELPGGAVKTDRGEILLRTAERRRRGGEFEDIAILSRPDGTQVMLRDIAAVKDTFQETDQEATFEGKPAALVNVFRVGDETPIEVADAVKQYVAEKENSLPDSVKLATLGDMSELYRDRVDLLMRNGYMGLFLVLLTLGLFLEMRLGFWVTMGIPISFIGSLLFLPWLDVSINMLSLFAFIVTLGIVVDDAIVVGESVFHYRHQGKGFLESALKGTRDVAGPVVFAVLTSVAAFMPLLFVPGVSGKFFRQIPIVVILVLLMSLIESLFVLPAHLAHSKPASDKGIGGRLHHAQQRFTRGLLWFVEHVFKPSLERSLRHRYLAIAGALALFAVSVGLVAGGRLHFTFMPRIDSDRLVVNLEMPYGTAAAETLRAERHLVQSAQRIIKRLEAESGKPVSRGLFAQTGGSGAGAMGGPARGPTATGSHLAEVVLYLMPSDEREVDAAVVARLWREAVGEIAGAEKLTYKYTTGPAASAPIDIQLSHSDTEVLETAAARLAAAYGRFAGVKDIDDGFAPGKLQLDLKLKPEARSLGITEFELARQVRSAFYGAEAVRQQRGRDEVRTYVRLPREDRETEFSIENFIVRAPNGQEIPLTQAATAQPGRAYTRITRVDGKRVGNVTADVEEGVANANEVVGAVRAEVLPELVREFPGLTWAPGGQQADQRDTLSALAVNFGFGLIAIFALLAVPFRSYVQPLIILSAIPFGFVGAVVGHLLLGYDLSLVSMMGVIALSGIVVNDSLVLIHSVNTFRDEEGLAPFEAVVAGASRRFRPILLTSLTTFFGLMPIILERSMQARFLIPMAISLGFGVLFATAVTLGIVPALYLVLEDVRALFGRIGGGFGRENAA